MASASRLQSTRIAFSHPSAPSLSSVVASVGPFWQHAYAAGRVFGRVGNLRIVSSTAFLRGGAASSFTLRFAAKHPYLLLSSKLIRYQSF